MDFTKHTIIRTLEDGLCSKGAVSHHKVLALAVQQTTAWKKHATTCEDATVATVTLSGETVTFIDKPKHNDSWRGQIETPHHQLDHPLLKQPVVEQESLKDHTPVSQHFRTSEPTVVEGVYQDPLEHVGCMCGVTVDVSARELAQQPVGYGTSATTKKTKTAYATDKEQQTYTS